MKTKRTFIIAEAGVNHNGSLETARRLIDCAVVAGADAVKFQTFKAERLVSSSAPKAEYQLKTTTGGESQLEMLKALELDERSHRILIEHCKKCGIQFLSTPFDLESLRLLVTKFDLPRLKISSGEITNAPLLLEAARCGKSVILSTGMSTLAEIEAALGVLAFGYTRPGAKPGKGAFQKTFSSANGRKALVKSVILLHCTTEYPAPFNEINLQAMDTLKAAFGLPVGLSDHSPGIAIPIAAAARGAVIIEKHFTLDRNLPGPDHQASLEPEELKDMVLSIRRVEEALGSKSKMPAPSELKNRLITRKSLVAAAKILKGERFSEKNLTIKRPGTGVSPMEYWDLLGKVAKKDFVKDEVI